MIVKETLLVEYIVRVDDGNTVFMSGGQEYLDKIVGILSEHRAFLEHVRTVEAANKDLRETNDVLAAKLDSLIIVNCQALACSAPVAAEVERLRAKWQAAVHSEEVFLKMQDRIVAEATAELQTEVERLRNMINADSQLFTIECLRAEVELLRAQLQTLRTDYRVACEDFSELMERTGGDW